MYSQVIKYIKQRIEIEGPHMQLVQADNLKAGLYLIKVIVNDETSIKKISVTKYI